MEISLIFLEFQNYISLLSSLDFADSSFFSLFLPSFLLPFEKKSLDVSSGPLSSGSLNWSNSMDLLASCMISSRLRLSPEGMSKSKTKDDMIQIQFIIRMMKRRIIRVGEATIAYLANDQYHLHILRNGREEWQVKSEERVVHCSLLQSLAKAFAEKNTVVAYSYLLLIDRRLTWTVFRVKSSGDQPDQIYTGTAMSERGELGKVVGVVEIEGKVVLVFARLKLLYLSFPENDTPGLQIFSKEFLPYGLEPQFQHSPFAIGGYLPNEDEHEPVACLYQKVSSKAGLLLLGYRSLTNGLSSIYALQYDCAGGYLLSGRSMIHNIEHPLLDIYSTTIPASFIVQTSQQLILWKVGLESEETTFFKQQIAVKSHLNAVVRDKRAVGHIGVATKGNIVLLTLSKEGSKLDQQQLRITGEDLIQVIGDTKKQEYYGLSSKEQVFFYTGGNRSKVLKNEASTLLKAGLRLNPNYNFIIAQKQRGLQKEKVLFGNHIFTYAADSYRHGLPFSNCSLLKTEITKDKVAVYMTSPLIGVQRIAVSLASKPAKQSKLKGQQTFEVNLQAVAKLSKEETLYLGEKYHITGEDVSEIGKGGMKISKMFQEATDYVTRAVVLSNELIVLSIGDQLHVFDSKLARRYIHCCSGEVFNIFALNDVNLLGVELADSSPNGNELIVLILELDKARKMKSLPIPQKYIYLQLSAVVNTAEFKLNIFGNRVVVCSNDPLHRFQLQKIQVQDFPLPLPESPLPRCSLVPVYSLASDKLADFLVVFRQQEFDQQKQTDEVEVYFASFNNKYLLKKLDLSMITLSYQRILTLTTLPRDHPSFAVLQQFEEGPSKSPSSFRNLLIFGERFVSMCSMKLGRVELEWLQDKKYLQRELDKIESLPKEVELACGALGIAQPLRILPTRRKQYFLVHNRRQLYYTLCSAGKAQLVSYYSLISDQFNEFRNNVSVGQLGDEQYMALFNKKMPLKDVKYLSDSAIFLLYDSAIVVLELGYNNSLVVRQQLRFKSQVEGGVVQIEQFLQNHDEHSIYLRDRHERIYLLQLVGQSYQILLHSNMDEDVLLFARVSGWNRRDRSYPLGPREDSNFDEQLVLRKDGQLLVKGSGESNPPNKFIYL